MLDAEPPAPQPPTPLLKRLLALVALLALLCSAAWSSWAIPTDRADFSARAPERSAAPVPAGER